MPKASCQIDGQVEWTVRSTFLVTAAARFAALLEEDAAGARAGICRAGERPQTVAETPATAFIRPPNSQSSTVVHHR